MTQPLPDAVLRHPDLPCLMHPAVRPLLDAGRFTVSIGPNNWQLSKQFPWEFARTYEIRAGFLAPDPGRYAQQLRRSYLEFSAAMEQQPPECRVTYTDIKLDNGLVITVWERGGTWELLGTFVQFNHQMLTESDWEQAWGTGAP
jgi:hypothetical protein